MGSIWRAPEREAPKPLEADDMATVKAGTAVWFALFLGQLPFYGWFAARGHAWWIWTCLVGTGLGLFGLWYVGRRQAGRRPPPEGQE